MKRNISLWQFAGFSLCSLGGTLLHFLYEWTGNSILSAPFSAVNESVWEHMKLLYVPLMIFALVQSRFFADCKQFWCIKLYGTAAGLLTIPAVYYTYNGAIGRSPDWVNITIFFIAVAVTCITETHLFRQNACRRCRAWLAITVLCVIGGLFILFTFIPPTLPLFRDPVNGTYGISA